MRFTIYEIMLYVEKRVGWWGRYVLGVNMIVKVDLGREKNGVVLVLLLWATESSELRHGNGQGQGMTEPE